MANYEMDRFGNKNYIEYSQLKDFSFPTHFHRCLEFIYMLDGEMNIFYNTDKFILKKGDAALFLPNEIHGFETKCSSNFASLIFSPDLVSPFMKQVENKKANSPIFILKEYFLSRELINFKEIISNEFKVNGIILLICGNYLEQVELEQKPSNNNSLMHSIIDYIGKNYKDDINLKSLANSLGYDSFYLSRYISKNMHTTFHKYLTQLRLANSIDLLSNSNIKIVDIAMQSGFSCIRTFNGLFKKAYGMSPSQYVKSETNLVKIDRYGSHI